MQEREAPRPGMTSLERVLARADAGAHEWLADRLLAREDIRGEAAPPPTVGDARQTVQAAG
jgi:hypothetical protein